MLTQLGINAKAAQFEFMRLADEDKTIKTKAIESIAAALKENCSYILEQNAVDVSLAKQNGMSESMIDRLTLTEKRVFDISDAALSVAALEDPCGKVFPYRLRPFRKGLRELQRTKPRR